MKLEPAPMYFYPRPPRGGRRTGCRPEMSRLRFLSTPSARRATTNGARSIRPQQNFYPRPPRGGRPRARQLRLRICCISIHALREEGDGAAQLPTGAVRDFYPRPPRGGRLKIIMPEEEPHVISIHALREEGDGLFLQKPSDLGFSDISIHALREEGDNQTKHNYKSIQNFYPRPPRGGRRGILCRRVHPFPISIHALREEGDPVLANIGEQAILFLSTPSARRATTPEQASSTRSKISIHALREEGDEKAGPRYRAPVYFYPRPPRGGRHPTSQRQKLWGNFYPRPPRGGRPIVQQQGGWGKLFLSTPSARRATSKPRRSA